MNKIILVFLNYIELKKLCLWLLSFLNMLSIECKLSLEGLTDLSWLYSVSLNILEDVKDPVLS